MAYDARSAGTIRKPGVWTGAENVISAPAAGRRAGVFADIVSV